MMRCAIGLDIGGTKIAGAAFDEQGGELTQITLPTPATYERFLETCHTIVDQLERKNGKADSVGICAPYADSNVNANIRFLIGKPLQDDLKKILNRPVPIGNDANCAALAEAMDGAGKGYSSVLGLIMGTGIGGGLVINGHIFAGANGLCGEIGHLPLPSYEASDGELASCGCGQTGCIEKLIAGPALARRYHALTGKQADARQIATQAQNADADALRTLDAYYTTVAKAMVAVLHSFDPAIITVSGGLNALPGLYDEVPKRWGKYALAKNPATKFVPGTFGSMAGLRGAAWLGKNS